VGQISPCATPIGSGPRGKATRKDGPPRVRAPRRVGKGKSLRPSARGRRLKSLTTIPPRNASMRLPNGTTTPPVLRGAWVLGRILGTPPRVPADVPDTEGRPRKKASACPTGRRCSSAATWATPAPTPSRTCRSCWPAGASGTAGT
jgi:hypothetical protein